MVSGWISSVNSDREVDMKNVLAGLLFLLIFTNEVKAEEELQCIPRDAVVEKMGERIGLGVLPWTLLDGTQTDIVISMYWADDTKTTSDRQGWSEKSRQRK